MHIILFLTFADGQAAYEQTGRARNIDETVEFLANALQRIELASNFPQELEDSQIENVQSCALHFAAAICEYLTTGIKNIKAHFAGEQSKILCR
jgi:hypothetical protein